MYKHHIFNGKMFSPLTLFVDGVVGFWHDYTDPTTWFQDTAGTTPATALGDPVGRVNDKSGNSITGLQATSAARPTYGRMPLGGVRNQLTFSENITNAAWARSGTTAASATSLVETSVLDFHLESQTTSVVSGIPYTQSYTLKKGVLATAPDIMQLILSSVGFGLTAYANVNVSTGAVEFVGATATCTSVADSEISGAFRFALTATATTSGASSRQALAFCNNDPASTRLPTYLGVVTSDVLVYKQQFEQASSATAYQKVVQAYDVTESGVASVDCLWFDGVDDFLDLTAAGAGLVRNTGRFTMFGGATFTSSLATIARSIFFASIATPATSTRSILYAAPTDTLAVGGRRLDADTFDSLVVAQSTFLSTVATGILDYTNSDAFLRKNGVLVGTDTAFQTDGNTSNTASSGVYVARLGSSYFGGFMTGVITVKATTLSESQLLQTEQYLGNQIGVTI